MSQEFVMKLLDFAKELIESRGEHMFSSYIEPESPLYLASFLVELIVVMKIQANT